MTERYARLKLFEFADFLGDSLVVTEDIPNLDEVGGLDWDDRVSSIKARPPLYSQRQP